MSKLSFRARAVDVNKPMPIHIGDGVPPDYEFASVSRAVLEMPTGMEKDEETEHHLQRALTAQQAYGSAEALAIPIPEMDNVGDRFLKLYGPRGGFKVTKQYIHVQPALGLDAEVPDYDMDSEDEQWLNRQVKSLKMEITPLKFENMIDRLEKGSGQTVVTLNEAKALLKEDDELTIAVYDYWLNKRLKLQVTSLIPQVKTERRDGSTSNNPYVAFRRRTEKMQTRKNRKNDEVSYEKMLKLKKDLQKSLIILEMLKRREKAKKEQGKLTVEILEKRSQMQDWDGSMLAEAEAKKDSMPRFHPIPTIPLINIKEWSSSSLTHNDQPKAAQKKREYRKVKHHKHPHAYLSPPSSAPSNAGRRVAAPPSSIGSPSAAPGSGHTPYQTHHFFGPPPHWASNQSAPEDDLMSSSPSQSDQENDVMGHPDGPYAFKRRPGCCYLAPRDGPPLKKRKTSRGDRETVRDPFSRLQAGNDVHAFHLASLPRGPEGSRCIGYARQRIGRGGRVILDRRASEWDDGLSRLDMYSTDDADPLSSEYAAYIRSNNIVHYRQSSQSMFCRPQRLEPPVQGSSQGLRQFSAKSSLVRPILVCNFDKQVQMLVHLRRSEGGAMSDPPGGDVGTSSSGFDPSHGPTNPLQNLNIVGDQKANLVISAIRGLAACKKEQEGGIHSPGSKMAISSAAKGCLANGRVGLSTMPAASILQLNFPLAGTRPSPKTLPPSGSNDDPSPSVAPTPSTAAPTPESGKIVCPVSMAPVTTQEAPSSSPVAGVEMATPVKSVVVDNGFSPVGTPSRPQDDGQPTKRPPEASKRPTVQNLLLSPPTVGPGKRPTKHLYASLPQQKLTNNLKLLHGLGASENTPTVSLISGVSPSSSAPFLSQKLQQKTPGSLKGGHHQVLVRAAVGAACSAERQNRESEPSQTSEDKNKTFAMEVT